MALLSIGTKILAIIDSKTLNKLFEKGGSIWNARSELSKLKVTIDAIQSGLVDAEATEDGSAAIKHWIQRVKSVLYDADDLFDQVATEDLCIQQIMKEEYNPVCEKVLNMLKSFLSANSIATRVEAIRKSLDEISTDMAYLNLVKAKDVPRVRVREDQGSFVVTETVIGRDEDKKNILKMLLIDNTESDVPTVIAISGIGGMGKTALARHICDDKEVKFIFKNRWFACIPDISNEKEFYEIVFKAMHIEKKDRLMCSPINEIRKSIEATKDENKKFLLVLDDVCDGTRRNWMDRISLLRGGAKGSRIIVTTRFPLVVDAVDATLYHHSLKGLSEGDSWNLFKRVAFRPGYENHSDRERLGLEILKSCRNLPLAIKIIGSLLYERSTIGEWVTIKTSLETNQNDEVMNVLKISYDHLPSNLKRCFAYCSLYPKDYRFGKCILSCAWAAQGYVQLNHDKPDYSDFLYLLRRGFFQDEQKDISGETKSCNMHDIMHDLALHVAKKESTRHFSLIFGESWVIPAELLDVKGLRSFMLTCPLRNGFYRSTGLDQLFRDLEFLRTLRLPGLSIEEIPSSIGELKLMRYLDLSGNNFKELPDSLTNLVNLFALELKRCPNFRRLPQNFETLINLRYLDSEYCTNLVFEPIKIEKLIHLHNTLTIPKGSEAELTTFLQQVKSENLEVNFCYGGGCSWQLPVFLQELQIMNYDCKRVPDWDKNARTNNLTKLALKFCRKVKYLPPLRYLPNLRRLHLIYVFDLEFIEEEENEDSTSCSIGGGDGCVRVDGASSVFFPCLEILSLSNLEKLKGWRRNVATATTSSSTTSTSTSTSTQPHLLSQFLRLSERWLRNVVTAATSSSTTSTSTQPHLPPQFLRLSELSIVQCPELDINSLPLRRQVWGEGGLQNEDVNEEIQQQLSSSPDEALAHLQKLQVYGNTRFNSLHVASPQLQHMEIMYSDTIKQVKAHTPLLRILHVTDCGHLEELEIGKDLHDLDKHSGLEPYMS